MSESSAGHVGVCEVSSPGVSPVSMGGSLPATLLPDRRVGERRELRQESLGICDKLTTLSSKWKLLLCTSVGLVWASNRDFVPLGELSDPNISISPQMRGRKGESA